MKHYLLHTDQKKISLNSFSKGFALAFSFLLFSFGNFVNAQTNTPCGAPALTVSAACTYTLGTTVGATYQSNAANGGVPTCASPGAPDVWYTFVAPAGGSCTITTDVGTITDGGMGLYSGPCGSPTQITCDDDSGPGLMSMINATGLTPGATYWVRVWAYGGTATGTFNICITLPPPPATNDAPCSAITLTPGAACVPTTASDVGATQSLAGCLGTADDDVWFKFTAANTTELITVGASGSFDPVVEVFTGPCGALTSLTGSCNDASFPYGGTGTASISGLTVGTTYWVRVYDYSVGVPLTTTFNICIQNPPPPPANDNPCGAVSLTPAAACTPTAGTTAGATQTLAGCAGTADDDVWFSFVAASTTQAITVGTAATMDPVVQVFSGTCGGLTTVNCNDGSYPYAGTGTGTVTGLTVGATYWVRVYDWSSTYYPGGLAFTICVTTPPPPGPGDDCPDANPFCTGTTYTFPNNTNQASLGAIDCLGSSPNPVWYFMQVATSGPIIIGIAQTNTSGVGIDVDYDCWGPFTSQAAGCASYQAGTAPSVSCSYSIAATETCTIPSAVAGQFYLLLLTNFSNQPGTISFSQTGGTGSTNCNILCNMTALTANPSACSGANIYSVSGTVTVTNPPSVAPLGTLTITSSCGGSVVINPPFGASIPYTIPGITATGGPCTVTAVFSSDPTCTLTTPYTSPAPCASCTETAGPAQTICSGATVNLTASTVAGATSYHWTGPAAYSSFVQNPTAVPVPVAAGTYTYTITTTTATSTCTATTVITVNPLPVITPSPDVTVCAGVVIPSNVFAAAPAGSTFAWTNSNTAIGLGAGAAGNVPAFTATNATTSPITATITVTPTLAGCPGTPDTYIITVNPQPTSTFTQTANQCLTGNTFTFTNTAAMGGGYTQSWNFGGGGAAPATSTTSPVTVTYTIAGTYTITHIVTGPGGCTSTTTSNVTITPNPTVTVNSPTICAGATATLTAAGATTYTWTAGLSAGAGNPVTGSPATTTSYTVTGTTAGCTGTAVATITVNPLPTITCAPITFCAGVGGTLTAGGASTYTWAPAAGLSATTGTTVTANPAATTTYTITGTSAAGCVNTTTVVVTVKPIPVTTVNSPTICVGGTATLTAAGATTYSWTAGLSSTTANPVTGSPATTTSYTVTGTTAGCSSTAVATITVNPLPTITCAPLTICAGGSGALTAAGAATYTWAPAAGLSATTGTSVTANPAATTTYTITGTSAAGCVNTATVVVTVNPLPTVTCAPLTICAGGSGTLTAAGASTYTWAPAAGLSATTGTTVTANPAATTTYTITGTSAAGCINTATVVVTVTPLPTITCAPLTICAGSSGTLTAAGAATYGWAPAAGLSATTGTTVTANPAATTTYTITGTSAAGCVNTSTVVVTVNPIPVTTVTSVTVCPGQTGTLTASGATTYSWTAGLSATTGSTVTGTPGATTSYTVTGTTAGCSSTAVATITIGGSITVTVNSPTICAGATATLTATGGTTYTWTAGLSAGTGTSVTGSPATTTSYTVTGNSGGCTGTATATITVNPLPTITCAPISICAGTGGTLTAGGAATYTWAPAAGLSATTGTSVTANPAATTTYTITGTSAAGCVNTTTVVVTVNPLPTVTCAPLTICTGSSGTLTAAGAATYSWAAAAGLSATTGTSVTANPAATTTYTVTGTSAAGCVNTATVIVTVNPLPTVTCAPITICTGIAGTLTASGANTYSWAPAAGLSATTGATVTANPAATTTYTITGTSALGCVNTTTVVVTVTPAATLSIVKTNVSCFGGANGTATVTPVGGTTPYTYSWAASGGTGATASGLTAGTYTVTVTTANGCISTLTTTITQPAGMTLTMGSVNATCGTANGQASVTVAGGTGPYTYSWAPSGGTAATATGLAAATYTVTVTDNNGCTSTNSVAVNNSLSPTASTTVIANVSCFGGNNGSASVTIAGGSSPYTQVWSPTGGTATTASALTAGTYTVTVTDNVGCVVTANATITQPPVLTASTTHTNVLCFGGSTGTATVTAAGGTAPYTYSWTPSGGTGTTASGLAAATYTCTVTDNKGCTTTATAVITQPTIITGVMSNTPASCFGGTNGTATVVAGGGTPGYSYSWAPSGGTAATASGLAAATYTVTITDLNGCTITASTTVAQPTLLTVSTTHVNSTCGNANGSATATAAGGTTAYSYSWAPSGGTAATAAGLAAATYTCTVTDAHGCTATSSTTVNDLSGLIASITAQVNVSCFGGNNGSVTITASGSTAPYTYSINGGTTYQVSGTFSSLVAGSYTIIAKDANGCTVSVPVTITQPAALTGAITAQINVLCNGAATGSVTVTGSGGTPAYTYSINGVTFGASGTFAGLTAGPYTVTVKDANGCTVTVPVTITQPTVLTAAISTQTNNICFGGNTGSATVTAGGGTTAYTYSWAPSGGTGATASALVAGVYTCTVTDANGCTATASATITQPTQVTVTATKVDATCGAANGSITATGANGTPGYTYSINGVTFQVSGTFTPLAAGTYTVTVKDANGCTNTTTITIVDLSGLVASITAQTNVSCNGGANGSVTVTASGSTAPYTYSLNAGAFGASGTFAGLTAGSYTVTAKDANGCTVVVPVTITQPSVLTGAITAQTNITCFGANNGSVTVSAGGGTPGYTYQLDGGAFVATTTFSGLSVGAHTIVAKDANGCTVNIAVTITQPTTLTLVTSSVNATCTAANGSATVVASGATPIYTYLWTPGGATASTAASITAGNYSVLVTDANGCSQTALVTVGQNPGGTATISSSNNVSCTGANDGSATVSMGASTPPYTYGWSPSGGSAVTATNLGPGAYTVTVTDGNGCITTANTIITEPTIVTGSFTNINEGCFGGSTGSSTITAGGGTAPYLYLWMPSGQTTSTASGLTAGSYTCTITDANGCTHTGTTIITEPTGMSLSEIHTDAHCSLSDGTGKVIPSGGTGPYTYSWSTVPVQTTQTVTGLPANTYVATVTDANGCSQTISVTVGNLAGPGISLFGTNNVSCNGLNDGSATVTVTGGVLPFTFLWNNGQTLPTATNLVAGTYTLVATDASGCIASISATITEPAILANAFGFNDPHCNGSSDGSITTNIFGGTAPYTYSWTPGGMTTANVTGLAAGSYSVQVTDAHGCTLTTPVILTNPAAVTASTTSTNVTCSGMCNGSATANALTGTGPFTYLWTDASAQTTATATNLCAGTFTVTVTDANGCPGTSVANITSPGSLSLNLVTSSNVTCFGACDGSAQVAVAGGTAPFSYMWMPTGTAGSSVTNLCAATYTVTVTDANGCTATINVPITQPNALIASISNTNVTCFGACDASATAVYTGGTGPFTFLWSPGLQTTPTIAGVCAGINNLTVTDGHGCQAFSSVVVTEPTVLAVTTTTTNSTCGNADGSACAAIIGGSPPFSYSWNDPSTQTTSCANGLNAGIYNISITDSHGCSVTNVANVNDIGAPTVTIPISSNVTCAGAANGSAQGAAIGGVVPYNILWTPSSQTTLFASGLSGGIYSIVVTDSVGCTGSASVTITEPGPLVSAITSSINTSCNLSCDGSATVLGGGGTLPYTYLWNDGATQTTSTATGLCAQAYNVITTDANGCTANSTVTISQPTAIVITLVSSTNVLCNGGNNGAITVSATGGTPGYTYAWTPAGTGAGPSVTNLAAGTYTVLVTDAHGCTATMTINITEPTALVLTPNSTNSTCGSSNGNAGVSVTGGVAGYTYFWSPTSLTTAIITGQPAGVYNVVVTDINGCTATSSSIILNTPGPLISSITYTEPICHGTPTGTATVIATGGTPLYTYLWSGPGSTAPTATALSTGTYTVTVTDANSCTVTGTIVLTQPAANQIIVSPDTTICIGQSTMIYGSGFGGTPGYNYTWTPSTLSGSIVTVSPTSTTSYTVFATDSHGCISPQGVITVNVNPQITVTATDVSVCSGDSVLISATANGGNGGPYTYNWSNAVSGASQYVSPTASPTNYTVTVDDGCSISVSDISTVIVNPQAVSFMTVVDTAGCEDFTAIFTGLSDIGVSYLWNFGDGGTSVIQSPSYTYNNSGSYNVTLTVTTAQGCTSTITTNNFIDVYPGPTAAFTATPQSTTTTAPTITFTDQSSADVVSWSWDFGVNGINTDSSSQQNPIYTYADSSVYNVILTVTNGFGCTDTAMMPIEVIPEYVLYAPNAFTPLNHDGINDTFMPYGIGIDPDNFEMMIFDRWGNMIFKTTDLHKGWDGKANGGSLVAQIDVYVWKIKTKDFSGNNHQYIGHVSIIK